MPQVMHADFKKAKDKVMFKKKEGVPEGLYMWKILCSTIQFSKPVMYCLFLAIFILNFFAKQLAGYEWLKVHCNPFWEAAAWETVRLIPLLSIKLLISLRWFYVSCGNSWILFTVESYSEAFHRKSQISSIGNGLEVGSLKLLSKTVFSSQWWAKNLFIVLDFEDVGI